jgi:hypothetical protein
MKLGLGQYAQRFAENGITASGLPHLTDQDLKDVGDGRRDDGGACDPDPQLPTTSMAVKHHIR